jgi:hypothetical protein
MSELSEHDFNPRSRMITIPGQRGGLYLPTRQRMLWFRQEHPAGSIETEIVKLSEDFAVFKATVHYPVYTPRVSSDDDDQSTWVDYVKCVGHGSETKADFKDFIEKAETKAIGRALAAAGFGTEGAFDEDPGRPADSPLAAGSSPNPGAGMASANQIQQISQLVTALRMEETIGPHLAGEYSVAESTELSFEQARELIVRLRARMAPAGNTR